MDKIKDMYNHILPETDPADLAEKIILGKCAQKKPAKKYAGRFIGGAAALCAALTMATVTVGAVSNWDFEAFFGSIFGESTNNMREYIVDGGKVSTESKAFDKFDFEVTGLAADENMAYLGLDIISTDRETLPDDVRLMMQLGDDGASWSVDCIKNENGRLSCLITLFGNIQSERKGVISISEIYSLNENNETNKTVYDSGLFRVSFDIESTLPTVKIEAPFELDIPALFYETKISHNDTVTEGVMSYTVNRLSLSGMSMVIDYEKPHPDDEQGFYEDDKIYLLMRDGSRAAVKSIGAYGSSSSDDGINFTLETGKIMFLVLSPIDVNNVSAVVFGDTVIHF